MKFWRILTPMIKNFVCFVCFTCIISCGKIVGIDGMSGWESRGENR